MTPVYFIKNFTVIIAVSSRQSAIKSFPQLCISPQHARRILKTGPTTLRTFTVLILLLLFINNIARCACGVALLRNWTLL